MTNERMCAINENSGAGNAKNGVNGKNGMKGMEMMNGKMTDEALDQVSGGAVGADTEEGRLLWEDLLREIHTELNRVEYETSEKETDRRIREQLEALSGKSEPDCTLLDSRQEEILQEERIFSDRNAKLENSIQHLDKQYKDLSERNRKYENEFAEAGNDLKFAKALRGSQVCQEGPQHGAGHTCDT